MYTIQRIEIFKDSAIPTAEGLKVFLDDPDYTEFSYNPHEQTMGTHKKGWATIWEHDISPNYFWAKINHFMTTGGTV